ncbi:MAG: hypothetical protein AAF721_04965 [Myxococcota bacterium]
MSRRVPAKRNGFDIRVELTPDEIWERLLRNPRVRESNDPAPEPEPPQGAPFLVARVSETEIRLRHWAGPADAPCPVVHLDLSPLQQGTAVSGTFRPRRTQRALAELGPAVRRPANRWAWAMVATLVLGIAMAAPVLIGVGPIHLMSVLMLLLFFTVPTALVFVPAVMIWNGEVRKGFVGPTWELLGEVFTPIALPSADGREAPFRQAIRGAS